MRKRNPSLKNALGIFSHPGSEGHVSRRVVVSAGDREEGVGSGALLCGVLGAGGARGDSCGHGRAGGIDNLLQMSFLSF